MERHDIHQPDYGTGKKKLGIYLFGLISCVILTVIAFGSVIIGKFSKQEMFFIIYVAAFIQFFVQIICFLRLNLQTEQARTNVMSILLTIVILISIILGSLWIMWNLNYNMV